jgi:hypothetical protein
VIRIVAVGDDGQGDLVGRLDPGTDSPKVAHQIETPGSPDPIMRRPGADREEKPVTPRGDMVRKKKQEKLDLTNPNQRSLLERKASRSRLSRQPTNHEMSSLLSASIASLFKFWFRDICEPLPA